MDHTTTTIPTIPSFRHLQLCGIWSAVDAADDYAQGANDRRLTYVLPVLQEAARDLLVALSCTPPEAGAPFVPASANTPQCAAPAATVDATLCREAIFRLAGETWGALDIAMSGPQTHACLAHLLRLITSLIGLVALSLIWDQPSHAAPTTH